MRLIYANKLRPKDIRLTICEDVVLSMPVVIYARKNLFLLHAINEKIEILKAAGLVEYWYYQDVDKRYLNAGDLTQAQVLTIGRLLGCFHLLMVGLAASTVCFIAELLASELGRVSRRLSIWSG